MIRPFYLVFFIFTSCLVAEQAPKYALLGQTVSLDPSGITVSPDDILWKHKGDKVVEFDSNEQRVYGTFDNRITLDWFSAELSISDLRYEDSGVYVLEAYTKKELKRASFTLEVIDRVAKPTISCEMNNGNSSIKSGNQATLKCSTEASLSPSLTKFEWRSQGTLQLGEKLIIPLGDEHDDKVYDCTVSNPLTKESTTFTAKDCYPEGGSAGLTAGISVAIIALILIILGAAFCRLKQKACFAKERGHDVEKPPGKTKGSGNEAAQDDDERRGLIHRESTLASKQPLRFLTQREINSQNDDTEDSDQEYRRVLENKQIPAHPLDSAENNKEDPDVHSSKELPEEECGPSDSEKSNDVLGDENKKSNLQPPAASEQTVNFQAVRNKFERHNGNQEVKVLENKQIPAHPLDSAENNKEDPDVHSVKELPEEERDPSDSEKSNDVLGDESENKKSNLQPPAASEQTGAEEEADEEAKSPSANGVPPHAAQLHLPETENSQNQSPQDGSGEHEDQTVSNQQDQDTTEKNEGDSSEPEEGKQSEDLNQKSSVNVQALRNKFEPHNGNQEVKVLENKRIPAVSPHPQDSAESNKGDPDVESPKESTENKDCDPSDSEKPNVVSDDKIENAESDLQPPAASKQPVKQEGDGGDDTSLPVGRPVSPLTQDSLSIAPQDGAGKQEKDASSDQVTGGTTDLSLDGSDLLNSKQENESNNHNDVKENSTVSEEKDPEATDEQNSQQKETRRGEDHQQESDSSEDKHDSDSANEREKIDQDKTLPSEPQSPITPKPDSSNSSTSPVTEQDKTRQNRGSDSSMEEAGKGEA